MIALIRDREGALPPGHASSDTVGRCGAVGPLRFVRPRTPRERYPGRGARTRRAASTLVPPSLLKAIAARGACSLIRLITAASSNGTRH